jgi:uncharacterized membrane protein
VDRFIDAITAQVIQLTTNFQHPVFLWGIPILFVVLLVLVTRNFVRYSMDDDGARRLRRMRVLVFLLRFVSMALLCIALATPFTALTKESDGNPHAVIMVDKSGSMGTYDTDFVPQLTRAVGAQLPTTVKEFGTEADSPIGDALLGQHDHILLISDGNANSGVDILDVAQVARENNLSINTIKLTPAKQDAAVYIDAPESLPLGYPAKIHVEVTSTDGKPVPLIVLVDGKQVLGQQAIGGIDLNPQLGTGYHKVEAHIATSDANPANNDFYRVVQVLDKPKILVVAKQRGALENSLSGLFDVTVSSTLPDASQLNQYYAVVMDDVNANSVNNVNGLADFLRDEQGGKYGNGLVVIGGFNSFDRGSYGGSKFETLLPIKVGKAKRTIGENNIVFVIQVSGSTGATKSRLVNGHLEEYTEAEPTIDTIKAQAVSAVNSLNLKNNVGVVAFGVSTEGQHFSSENEALQHSVVRISEIKPLYSNKQELVDKIPRITGGGTTAPDIALRTAVDMLKDKTGDKTIILLTNGRFSAGLGEGDNMPAKANTLAVIENAKKLGIKTQTLGVGSTDDSVFAKKVDESFLKQAAATGDSTYDRATNMASLMIKFGDPKEKGFGEQFSLVPLSLTHFITKDVELNAQLNGYNEVVPKDGSRMLVATDSGNPAVTVWNYFNGRVAAVTVFTADGLGPLLQGNNSDLVRNTVLWAVGDPSRKQEVRTSIKPGVVGQKTEVTFVSKQPIAGNCPDTQLSFDRSSGDTYIFTFTPQKPGFGTACNVPYAVNGESEYWHVGESAQLKTAVGVTGGAEFTPDQVDAIVKQIKTVSTRVTTEKTEVRNPFIFLAITIFLLEIFIRRLTQYKKS